MNGKTIRVIAILAFFNFVFLGTEYLFDNMMAYVTDSKGVVIAQSYILGASVLGFLLFPVINRFVKKSIVLIMHGLGGIVGILCVLMIQRHESYFSILISGCIAFVILGMEGSAVHYLAACALENSRHLSKTVGLAYAGGILLQFLNNNLINSDKAEAVILSVALLILLGLLMSLEYELLFDLLMKRNDLQDKKERYNDTIKERTVMGGTLIVSVALMTCIFASLDNIVTLEHATGSVDIGQWPRLILALSGLTAGVLFDIKEHRYMSIIMYCVVVLSTICAVVIQLGGSFLIGLIVFYFSAGFFVVYFTTGFMELSYYMYLPELWAGLGRVINNLGAVLTGTVSVSLLIENSGIALIIITLVLFVLISITTFIHNQYRAKMIQKSESCQVILLDKQSSSIYNSNL